MYRSPAARPSEKPVRFRRDSFGKRAGARSGCGAVLHDLFGKSDRELPRRAQGGQRGRLLGGGDKYRRERGRLSGPEVSGQMPPWPDASRPSLEHAAAVRLPRRGQAAFVDRWASSAGRPRALYENRQIQQLKELIETCGREVTRTNGSRDAGLAAEFAKRWRTELRPPEPPTLRRDQVIADVSSGRSTDPDAMSRPSRETTSRGGLSCSAGHPINETGDNPNRARPCSRS